MFDKYLSYNTKVIIALLCGGYWIYFRTYDCYSMIPRRNILASIYVMIWMYINYYEPLVAPLGLLVLYIYAKFIRKQDDKEEIL